MARRRHLSAALRAWDIFQWRWKDGAFNGHTDVHANRQDHWSVFRDSLRRFHRPGSDTESICEKGQGYNDSRDDHEELGNCE